MHKSGLFPKIYGVPFEGGQGAFPAEGSEKTGLNDVRS